MIKKIIRKLLDKLNLRAAHCLMKDGYLVDTGWLRSFRAKKSVDKDGYPIPWIAYPATDFIKSKINKEMCVFEFGSGASTQWWCRHVKQVDAFEHDADWFKTASAGKPANTNISLRCDDSYFTSIEDTGSKYDIVVIDGVDRNRCVKSALAALKSDGVIIWDDSEREEYQVSFELLHQAGFKRIFFTGLSPIYNNKVETSIFYRNDNCLGI